MNYFNNFDEVNQTCFLCGEDFGHQKKNQEHIFPQWILSNHQPEFEKQRFLDMDGSTGNTNFWRQKLEVHQKCNEIFGAKLESKISRNNFNSDELWLWSMKIICGLIFHQTKYYQNIPGFESALVSGIYDDDFSRFWEEQHSILSSGKKFYNSPSTIIELEYLFDDGRFFHTARFDLGVFWIAFNNQSFLIFFNQNLSAHELEFAQTEWKEMFKSETLGNTNSAMFYYNYFTAKMAIEIFFARRNKIWNSQMVLPTFDRPPRTKEFEVELYRSFGLEANFNNHGGVEFRTIT